MINFNKFTGEIKQEHNLHLPQIPVHSFRTPIVGGSR